MTAIVPSADAPPTASRATWRDYYELGKPRVVMLIMITAVAGMFLATSALPAPNVLIFGTLGIAFAASAAAAVNHVLDRRFDEPGVHPPELLGQRAGVLDHVLAELAVRGVVYRARVEVV